MSFAEVTINIGNGRKCIVGGQCQNFDGNGVVNTIRGDEFANLKSNNTLNFFGTPFNYDIYKIYGANSGSDIIQVTSNNVVNILSSSWKTSEIYGAYALNDVENNSVNIKSNIDLRLETTGNPDNIFGGVSQTGNAIGNKVFIEGSNELKINVERYSIYGGVVVKATDSSKITNNLVSIKHASITYKDYDLMIFASNSGNNSLTVHRNNSLTISNRVILGWCGGLGSNKFSL